MDLDDLVGTAYLTLVKAARNYDSSRGPYEHFGKSRIKYALRDAHRAADMLPRSLRRCAGHTQSIVAGFGDWEPASNLLNPEMAMIAAELEAQRVRVVQMIADGYSNAEIAIELGCNVQRIKNMCRAIFDMTGASNRTELAVRHTQNPEMFAQCLSRRKYERIRKANLPDRIARLEAKLAELRGKL